MIISLKVRVEDYPHSSHIVGYSGDAEDCIQWLSGFLCAGVIVDYMKVL